jgi:hypothetical protein
MNSYEKVRFLRDDAETSHCRLARGRILFPRTRYRGIPISCGWYPHETTKRCRRACAPVRQATDCTGSASSRISFSAASICADSPSAFWLRGGTPQGTSGSRTFVRASRFPASINCCQRRTRYTLSTTTPLVGFITNAGCRSDARRGRFYVVCNAIWVKQVRRIQVKGV